MSHLPTGTVTFLFSDIEGSTRLAREYPKAWEATRARHDAILSAGIKAHHGYVFEIVGDQFCSAFHKAADALKAALKIQQDMQREAWGEVLVRVRIGLHTGEAETSSKGYRGYLALCLVQRVMSAGHGGQVLISGASENLLRDNLPENVTLQDMGRHRFKDVPQPVRIFQLLAPGLQSEFPHLRSFDILPNNLPAQLTSFVGREKELAEVKKLLLDAYLLTLLGPGGTGKTRLSIQAANELLDQFPDGVWLVELAPILDPQLVPRTTAIAIGLRDEPQRPVIDMLCDYLRDKKMLILLDNCEHLVEICAHMAEHILRAAPDVRILASSREALGIACEVTYPIPSLGLPDLQHLPPIESLSQYEAVKLFIDRAVSAVPSFAVTNTTAPAVAQICYRLDGIPLAIELAAAKIRVLSVEQILTRLDDRFRLLTGGSRTALERHQTLRAAMDWSYNLLPADEQTLFRRLSVFVGGWTLEAAESVCGNGAGPDLVHGEDVLHLLGQLINKSIVIKEEAGPETRYHMLETLRQYGHEKLIESGERELLRDHHLEYFQNLAETAAPYLREAKQIEWLKRLDAEYENLRTALTWAQDSLSAERLLRLAGALGAYWQIRLYWLEGAKWLDRALDKSWDTNSKDEKAIRAKVFYHRAEIAHELDELELIRTSAESALALCEQVDDLSGVAYSRALLAGYLMRKIDFKQCKPLLEQSLKEFQDLGNTWGESFVLGLLARVYLEMDGRKEEYREIIRKRIALARNSGDRYLLANALAYQVMVHIFNCECGQAQDVLKEVDRLFTEIGSSHGINLMRFWHAQALFVCGELGQAKAEAELFIQYCQRVGEKNLRGIILRFLGILAEMENDHKSSLEFHEKSLSLSKEIGASDLLAAIYASLGRFKYFQGEVELGMQYALKSLEIVKQGGAEANTIAHIFNQIGGMCIEERPHITTQFLGFGESIWRTIPLPRNPTFDKPYFERYLSAARDKLDESDFNSAWEAGLKMNLEQAIELAVKTGEEGPLMVQTSTLSADRMRHPVTCVDSGVSPRLPNPSPAAPVSAGRKKHRRRK
jgi:predicted ATPase/class 3 adenylate cyclase